MTDCRAPATVTPSPTSGRIASRNGRTVRGRRAHQPSHTTRASNGHTQSGVCRTMSIGDGKMNLAG